MEKNVIV